MKIYIYIYIVPKYIFYNIYINVCYIAKNINYSSVVGSYKCIIHFEIYIRYNNIVIIYLHKNR